MSMSRNDSCEVRVRADKLGSFPRFGGEQVYSMYKQSNGSTLRWQGTFERDRYCSALRRHRQGCRFTVSSPIKAIQLTKVLKTVL